eukprot:CAMPEP_0195264092 /NCGR_PEP_ID=MMETSP0706-20130129/10666_1 /TAXON_ID=33640 /ORGANISM="Asterionellopsis glacialis, Strain CCMP134" /LENGTH=131 /DNA_ID=CAMNT_0040318341 /DNA_START=20 /DNA_END=415 /DNA_ORIENTATION=-
MTDDNDNNKENPLRSGIKAFVKGANAMLASLEHTSQTVGKPVIENIQYAGHQGAMVGGQLVKAYEVRKQYGPEIICGSALVVTSLVGLRRGRFSGALAGGLTAGFTYLGVYEVDFHQLKDKIIKGLPPTSK